MPKGGKTQKKKERSKNIGTDNQIAARNARVQQAVVQMQPVWTK